ncbi:uncharacterized protein V1516DRAFT_666193 [Lipomyces oligophaga]|uniref:uncharacterized protein n=1 Tax=Lipomyces oligophaga TaxID=45792 RepID=UPI0034CEEF2E
MHLRSLALSLAALLAGVPVALAFFNSTLVTTEYRNETNFFDISTLQGQRVVKLVQYTSPSITTTWAFFNLFSPLEMTEDFPEDSEDCIGHEGCIVRTLSLRGSKPITIHAVPIDHSFSRFSINFAINLDNTHWAYRHNHLKINFFCNDSVTNSMKSDISPIESYQPRDFSKSDKEIFGANTSSNFLGVRRFRSFGSRVILDLDSNITCNETDIDFFSGKSSSDQRSLARFFLTILFFILVAYLAGSCCGRRRRRKRDNDLLDSVETVTGISHANYASNISRRIRNTGAA